MGRPPEPDRAAEDNLRNWEAVGRDDAVRDAAAAGLSVARIQKITGLATTIMRILKSARHGRREPPVHRLTAIPWMSPARRLQAHARTSSAAAAQRLTFHVSRWELSLSYG